jgi:hypothetical protein
MSGNGTTSLLFMCFKTVLLTYGIRRRKDTHRAGGRASGITCAQLPYVLGTRLVMIWYVHGTT